MSKVLKTLVAANARLAAVKKEMGETTLVGRSGGGVVQVKINGHHQPSEVIVAPEVLREDPETVQDLILLALQDAYNQADQLTRAKTSEVHKKLSPFGLSVAA